MNTSEGNFFKQDIERIKEVWRVIKLFQPFSLWISKLYALDLTPADPIITSWSAYFSINFGFDLYLCFFYTLKKVIISTKTNHKFFSNFLKKRGMSFLGQIYEILYEQYNLSYIHLKLLKALQECIMHFLNS